MEEFGPLIFLKSNLDLVFDWIYAIIGGLNYIYNVLTGYHYKAPKGIDVPKGKHFNPYFDHMIIGMPRQLVDGLIEYDDGTPASTP
jgi:ubiquinol-cytochrome c reductase cytochrome c1 subunit